MSRGPARAPAARPRAVEDLARVLDQIPYCRFLGITVEERGGEMLSVLRFGDRIVGNQTLPAIHGGVIGAFLEMAAIVELLRQAPEGELPRPINLTVAYLRSARAVDTLARAFVTKHGRRVANVRVEAWQDAPERPVATAQGHFLVGPSSEP